MINLTPQSSNNFIIYNDTTNLSNFFLISFTNGFSKETKYVIPKIITRNSKFIEFQIILVSSLPQEDPLNGSILLEWDGNFDYKIWNTTTLTLDPTGELLIDEGQAFLIPDPTPEITWNYFQSNINNNVVYLTKSTTNSQKYTLVVYVDGVVNSGPYTLKLKNQMTFDETTCMPVIMAQSEKFIQLEFTMLNNLPVTNPEDIQIKPNGTYDYGVYDGNTLLYSGQLYLKLDDEITYTSYTSQYDNGGGSVYYSSGRVWNKVQNFWELCDWNWNE